MISSAVGIGAMSEKNSLLSRVVECGIGAESVRAKETSTKPRKEGPQYDITTVICTYRPNRAKLFATLTSVVMQKGVRVQAIVVDDGSEDNCFNDVRTFFDQLGFSDYLLLGSESNLGTVLNVRRGVITAEAPFVKLLSPGDYLYSSTTLAKITRIMLQCNAGYCFGKAVHYRDESGFEVVDKSNPAVLAPYPSGGGAVDSETALRCQLYYQDFVLGASMAFERESLLACLEVISGVVTYCEDYSAQLYLLCGGDSCYLEDYVIWYEEGSGVSTLDDPTWNRRLQADAAAFYALAVRLFPANRHLAAVECLNRAREGSKIWRLVLLFLRDPRRLAFQLRRKRAARRYSCREYDRSFYDAVVDASREALLSR